MRKMNNSFKTCRIVYADMLSQQAAAVGRLTPPKISTLSPPAGSVAGGETLTLTGCNRSGASVEIGGTMAPINSSTDTEIIFLSPPHAPGAVNVIVKTDRGSAMSRGGYSYQ